MNPTTDDIALARRFAQAGREPLVDLCARLVAARSPQPAGDTTAPVEVFKTFLDQNGLQPRIVAATPFTPVVFRFRCSGCCP